MPKYLLETSMTLLPSEKAKARRAISWFSREGMTARIYEVEETPQEVPKEKTLTTFYCGILPLKLYTEFGAENVHHAYNKAAKLWGDKNQTLGSLYITKQHRLIVNTNEEGFSLANGPAWTKVSHSEFTAIIKAWRSAQ